MHRIISCCIAIVFLAAGPASAQWNTDFVPEDFSTYTAVDFPSVNAGYIVGGGGLILKSTDGGATWVSQTSPGPDTFFDVFFFNDTAGWAVGDNGVIASTADGTTWTLHAQSGSLTTQDINSVFFVGSNGWMGSDDNNMYYTTDAGATWDTMWTFPDDVTSLSFVDANVGYAAVDGSGIYYTVDGGTNWTSASVNLGPYPYTRTDIEAIHTVDATTAVASGWGSIVGPQPTIILVSTDAGVTWSTPDALYPWSTYAYGYGITMFDDGEVVIVGSGSSHAAPVLHSDGSDYTTWSASPAFFGDGLNGVAAVPGTDIIVAVGDEGCIARSIDRGVSWDFYFDTGFGFQGIMAFTSNGRDLFAVGTNGLFMRKLWNGTAQGDWEVGIVAPNYWAPVMESIWYVDGVLYAAGRNEYLCKSTDLGDTWTQLSHAPSFFEAIYGQHWFDENNGILVGESNRDDVIWVTSDGGQTKTAVWSAVNLAQFNSISFATGDPLNGVIAGDDMSLLYTADGGATWNQAVHDSTSTNDLEEVHMASPLVAWAVGDNGTIMKTVDGGANWATQPSWTTSIELMDVYFGTELFGWISGNDQTVYYTDDGGINWYDIAPTLLGSGNDVNAVYLNGTLGELYIGSDECQIHYRMDSATDADTPVGLPFVLQQNYPNPFNPATTIEFSIDRASHVSLNVYDVAGRLVSTLVNGKMEVGSHEVGFNARGLASGVYFYKLKTGDKELTRKMILLR